MGKNLLVGVGSKARKVKALYVGVGGKARKVKKVYVGVGGKARLVYTSYVAVKGIDITYEKSGNRTLIVHATVTPANATDRRIIYTSSADNSDDDWYMNDNITFTYDPDVDAGTATFTLKYTPSGGGAASIISGRLTVMVSGHSETKKAVHFSYNWLTGFNAYLVTEGA